MSRPTNAELHAKRFPENLAEAKIRVQELNLEKAKIDLELDKLRTHIRSLKRASTQP